MDYEITLVDSLSSISAHQRAANLRWYAQQGEQTQIETEHQKTLLIRKHRNQPQANTPEFNFAMHALAIQKMVWMESAQTRKGRPLSDEEFEKVQDIRINRIKGKSRQKSSPKLDIIRKRLFFEIQTLRAKGLSWRQISDYLQTHHKIRLAHSYIQTSYLKLVKEREKASISRED
jgi:hypothetical protein